MRSSFLGFVSLFLKHLLLRRIGRVENGIISLAVSRIHFFFFFSSRRRHTRSLCDWSSDVCSSDLEIVKAQAGILETDETGAAETKLHALLEDLIADSPERDWIEGHLRPLVGLSTGEIGRASCRERV